MTRLTFIAVACFVLMVAVLIHATFSVVPPGHVGILAKFGRPQTELLLPGLRAIPPFVSTLTFINVEPQALSHQSSAPSRDYTEMHLALRLTFVVQDPMIYFVRTRGPAQAAVDAAINASLKTVLEEHLADAITQREGEVRDQLVEELRLRLSSLGIRATEIYIDHLGAGSERVPSPDETRSESPHQAMTH